MIYTARIDCCPLRDLMCLYCVFKSLNHPHPQGVCASLLSPSLGVCSGCFLRPAGFPECSWGEQGLKHHLQTNKGMDLVKWASSAEGLYQSGSVMETLAHCHHHTLLRHPTKPAFWSEWPHHNAMSALMLMRCNWSFAHESMHLKYIFDFLIQKCLVCLTKLHCLWCFQSLRL